MTRALAVGLLLAACGEVSSSPDGAVVDAEPAIDAVIEADAAVEVDAAPARCLPTSRFGTPVPLSTLNSDSFDGSPFLTADERTIYFASTRPGGTGGYDIYVATRSSPTASFDEPALLNGVNSADSESRPVLTADGLTLYGEVRRGSASWHVERASRERTSDPFGAFAPEPILNDVAGDAAPFVLPDQRAIYFVSSKGGNADIYRAERGDSAWRAASPVIGIDLHSAQSEDYPVVSPDERTLLFTSARPGGAGASEMYIATRASITQGFGAPALLTELNTADAEQPGWLSADGCVLYYTSAGNLFVATREP